MTCRITRLPRGFLGLCEGGPIVLMVLNTQMNLILCLLLIDSPIMQMMI
jgi:hypothetical protein